jgi:hypothetical protein
MKYVLILSLFTTFLLGVESSQAQDNCIDNLEYLCSGEAELGRISALRGVNQTAFAELLREPEMEDLICKNFDRRSGELVYDFLWNRSCWDWKYRKSIRRMGIKSCDDFVKHGASKNFILNCHSIIDKYLVEKYYTSINFKTQKIIERVKFRMLLALSSESYAFIIERTLKNIADTTHLEFNLSKFEASFMSTKDICKKMVDPNFCNKYKDSEKVFLSLGAHALYMDADLEMFVAKMIAEYLADSVKFYERFNLQSNYVLLLSEVVPQWKLEKLLARSMSSDQINKETLSAMLIQKYIRVNNLKHYFKSHNSLDQLCINGSKLKQKRSDYYYNYFYRLHPKDRMELILCSGY